MAGSGSVALHAEALPAHPSALRWVLPGGLPATGRLIAAPGSLGELLNRGGPLVKVLAERGALWTWLAEGSTWVELGPCVRDAITAAAARFDEWQFEPAADELLELVARDVLERTQGAYITSHGGGIELLSAADGEVAVHLTGACVQCPAAGGTLHDRIEAELRQRLGDRVLVHADGDCDDRPGRPGWWPKLLLHR